MTRLYLHPLEILVGAGHFGIDKVLMLIFPMDFIIMRLTFRWSILVVEPSPGFRHRRLAADCPISSFLRTFTFALSGCGVVRQVLEGFPAIHPIVLANRYPLGRLCVHPTVLCSCGRIHLSTSGLCSC